MMKHHFSFTLLLASTFLSPTVVSATDYSFTDNNNHLYISESDTYDTVSGTASGINGDYYCSAIQNKGHIKDLSASFDNNTTTGQGGAVFNDGYNNDKSIIDRISGNFTGNTSGQEGGAIYNSGIIGNIVGSKFENNQAIQNGPDGYAQGGAIFNSGGNGGGIINDITDVRFIGNTTTGVGGAVSNCDGGKINDISGIFKNNSANQGGVLYNFGASVNSIGGTFEENRGQEIIFNPDDNSDRPGHIGTISGTFLNNTASSVIYNMSSNIDVISADFTGNTVGSSDAVIKNLNSSIGTVSGGKTFSGNSGGVVIMNLGTGDSRSAIGDITANFIKNNVNYQNGVIYNLNSSIGNISGTFSENTGAGNGGAIWNKNASVQNISGKFEKNTAGYLGGAIVNEDKASIADIFADFTENASAQGGAIANNNGSSIADINGNFSGNNASFGMAQGGAIWNNNASVNDITASFSSNISGEGGAIYNNSNASIGNINANFAGNKALNGQGGAIFNNNASIKDIAGNFTDNNAAAHGGAIWNNKIIGNINGSFVNNSAGGETRPGDGGAIWNNGTAAAIGNINGSFVNNRAVLGGAIYNAVSENPTDPDAPVATTVIGNLNGDFIGNNADFGGAIWNNGSLGSLSGTFSNNTATENGAGVYNVGGNAVTFVNSSFINNTAQNENGNLDIGSAIYSEADITLEVNNGYTSLISGNKTFYNGQTENDALYVKNAALTLRADSNGTMIFDDHVNGNNYNMNIYGDGTGVVRFNGLVKNVNNFNLYADSIVHLGIDARIYARNYYADPSAVITPRQTPHATAAVRSSGGVPLMTVDVFVDRATNKVHSGTITVEGDVAGTTHVLVNALNPDILDNYQDAVTPFLYAPDDENETSAVFEVARVNGSPYLWYAEPNVKEKPEKGNIWYLALTNRLNPNFDRTKVAPEVISYIGLQSAAIEQTRNLSNIVRNRTAAGKTYCAGIGCGLYEDSWNGHALSNVWVDVDYVTSSIDKPVNIDADIWGITGGFDLQKNINHKFGVFASYRQGDYDLSGKGVYHHADSGSKIDIDSYLGGLYYRYDKNNWWGFATLFAGIQKADLKTDDGAVKTDTDGNQLGGSIEGGKLFALTESLTLEPSLGAFYTQIDFDNIRDGAGKTAKFETVGYWELEGGIKLEKTYALDEGSAKVYFKPSVIQTLSNSDKVNITGLYPISTYHDQTLGRIELGSRAPLNRSWSLYGWINYTFGSSYDATAFGAGLNYAF